MCLAVFVTVLDGTIVNVALPSLAVELGASTRQLQWIVDAYLLVFTGLLLAAGGLGDRFGRKRALIVGLVVFAATSALAGAADSAERADRRPGLDGRRRRADLPGHAGDHHQHLHRPRASGPRRSASGAR